MGKTYHTNPEAKHKEGHKLVYSHTHVHDNGVVVVSFYCVNPGCQYSFHTPVKSKSEFGGSCYDLTKLKEIE